MNFTQVLIAVDGDVASVVATRVAHGNANLNVPSRKSCFSAHEFTATNTRCSDSVPIAHFMKDIFNACVKIRSYIRIDRVFGQYLCLMMNTAHVKHAGILVTQI